MFPLIHGALAAHHHRAAEQERLRRLEEEECMSGYTPAEASGPWQFKIVRGTFKTARQVEAVQQEQAEYGWVLVEIFDQHRIRFKRPAGEAAKDAYREGNPYATFSKATGPGCGAALALFALLAGGAWYWLV
jgi:hypothetical protein